MKRLSEIPHSQNPRMDHANVSNAPHLFGDPDYGDFDEEGDISLYGDIDELSNDTDPLATFTETSGDIEEEGDLRSFIKKNKKLLIGVGAGGASLGVAAIVRKKIQQAKARKIIQKSLAQEKYNQTIRQAALVQSSVNKMTKASLMRFFSLRGAKMNSSPIDPLSTFVTDMFKNMLDRQAMDTPFLQETAIGAFAAGTWTATATGAVTNRFYVGLILQIGTNVLNAAPATIIQVTGTFPTINGNLVVAANPWLLTYEQRFDVRFLLYPWQLVSNKPMPVLGQYSNASNIVVTVTGIPSASAVNLVVPGSIHPWTVAMRNALIK
jgi:hypothetical protein